MLRAYKEFVKTYVNDVVIFFQILEKHIEHLRKVFALFVEINIAFKSFKTFLEYLSIFLLKQKIDNLNLTTIEKKLKTILNFRFFPTFKYLKTYLNKTNYFCQYIFYYVQKAKNL